MDILLKIIAIMLPIFLGYFFKLINLFNKKEINTLRKFVVKVTVPFIILRNLYEANMETLNQIFPSITAFVIITILSSTAGYFISRTFIKKLKEQNSYLFSTFVGNYGFLGWGVMAYFYGNAGFTRAVFFSFLFWPVFLTSCFTLAFLATSKEEYKKQNHNFKTLLFKNASIPISMALISIVLNVTGFKFPTIIYNFIDKFASITIPMILFTIGLNFNFKMKLSKFKIILAGSFHRLILAFSFGIISLLIVNSFFTLDIITKKVILIESAMPTAAMTPFFSEYVKMDKKLQAGIITFSTILSLLTIPFWFYIVENII